MDPLSSYLPQDRRIALARGIALPEQASGAALFADISGFTPLTEALPHFTRIELGPLTDAEAAQAIRAKLAQLVPERKGAAIPALIAGITAKAQGNPFYVEELLNYLRRAGEAAAARYANEAALDYLGRALEGVLQEDTAERYALLLTRERVYRFQGDAVAQAHDLAALEQLAVTLDDVRRAEVAARQADYAERTGDYAGASAAAARAVALAQAAGAPTLVVEAYFQWAWALLGQGDYAAAYGYYEQNVGLSRMSGDLPGEGHTLGCLGDIARALGDYRTAQAYCEQALDICRTTNQRQYEGWMLGTLGQIAEHQDDSGAAETFSRQALDIEQAIGDHHMEAYALTALGHARLDLGYTDAAREAYAAALAIRRELGQPNRATEPLAGLARVTLAQGDITEALAHVEAILAYLAGGGTLDGTDEPPRVSLTCSAC
jgi:tetratricopeptide (TPR) repeat protein